MQRKAHDQEIEEKMLPWAFSRLFSVDSVRMQMQGCRKQSCDTAEAVNYKWDTILLKGKKASVIVIFRREWLHYEQ